MINDRTAMRWGMIAFALLLGATAPADVIEMTDGRRFEGEIVNETAKTVSIDTKVTPTIRTTLQLDRNDIANVERRPLPEGFFDPPPAAPRVSAPADDQPGDTLYLTVPIHGTFGQEIFADGIDAALRYARRYRIRHVVFDIDSTGGDLDEVRAAYDLLRRHERTLTFHAVVHDCVGGALALALWCDSLHMLPRSRIGGSQQAFAEAANPDEEKLVRRQIAREVVRQTRLSGEEADIVTAMIDPAQTLTAWRDETGAIKVADSLPSGVSADRVIFQVGAGELLVIDDKQAAELGVDPFDGSVQDLGGVLGIEGWERESDYGQQAMTEAVVRKRKQAADAQAKYAAQVQKNIRRREALETALEESLRRASEWNPSNESYDYYVRRWGWGWGGGRGKLRMTHASRQMWQQRTDTTLNFLQQAADAVTALERLDREAVKLDLEPTFKPQDLHWVKQDIQTKYNYFVANRDKR